MKKIRVNISAPSNWGMDGYIRSHSPKGKGEWGEFQFFHNRTRGYFDYWIVLGGLDFDTSLLVPSGNCFFVVMEERDVVPNIDMFFLNQFDQVITSRDDLHHSNIVPSHYFTKWHIHKSYDELKEGLNQKKTKCLSAIISSRVEFGQHLKRYAFINKLKGHFKNRLDWYSKNENPIIDKWNGISPYNYSIAIENSSYNGYFTEKIIDVFLSNSVPVYWGAPDVNDFFPSDLIIPIDLDDYLKSIDIIETECSNPISQYRKDLLHEVRSKILDEYQFLPWLTQILLNNGEFGKYKMRRIYKEKSKNLTYRIRRKINYEF